MFGGFVKSFSQGRRGITAPAVETLPDLTGTTDVAWADDSVFSFWTSTTSTSTDILASNQNQTYVLAYAHREIRILADGVQRVAIGTYSSQTTSPKIFRIAVANGPNSLRFPQTVSTLSSNTSLSSSSGSFLSVAADNAYTIPANTYFLIGIRQIAFAANRSLANSRSATHNNQRILTVWPTIYRMGSQTEIRLPVQFGSFGVPQVVEGYMPVLSLRFKQSDHQGNDVTVTEESPFAGGGNSYLFSSSVQSYIQRNASEDWALGTGDFTIEWFSRQSTTDQFQRVFSVGNFSSPYNPIRIGVSIESDTFYFWRNGTPTSFGSAGNLNAWIHWAIVRISGVTRIYKNGVQFGSDLADTTNYSVSTIDLYIGNTNVPATNAAFVGDLTNFRWIKGLGVYTAAGFTPPTSALTAEASDNPYGGANTVAVGAGFTKLLLVP